MHVKKAIKLWLSLVKIKANKEQSLLLSLKRTAF